MSNAAKIIADPMRREILRRIWKKEESVNTLVEAFNVTQPAISFHLKVLREGGLVEVRKEGTVRYYRAKPDAFGALRAYLENYWKDQLMRLKDEAEIEARSLSRRGK